jgi:hypothetical protein
MNRIPFILAEDLFATDESLQAELGIERTHVRAAVAILYQRRRVDRFRDYIVLPGARQMPAQHKQAA